MPASQTGFGNFFLERNVSMPTGYQIPVLGCPPGVQQQQQQLQVQHLAAMAAAVPISYPGLQGYNFLPYTHHRHITHMSNSFDLKATSPYHHALLAARGTTFYPPFRPGAAEDPSRVVKVATRESTGALKAWLNEHLKNPYPTKGEKIMLAIITKMSLTQVSTWFANARRRLKKENRVSWASRGKSDEEEDEEEEQDGESEDEDGPLEKCHLNEREKEEAELQSSREQVGSAPVEARLEAATRCIQQEDSKGPGLDRTKGPGLDRTKGPGLDRTKGPGLDRKAETPSALENKENTESQKPKIWSLAETATSETVKKPADSFYPPAGKLWADWASRTGLLLPTYYTTHEIV